MPTIKNKRSIESANEDVLPRLAYYRHRLSLNSAQRPTLEELIHGNCKQCPKAACPEAEEVEVKDGKQDWITGVLVRTMLNIWGIPLFLRMSWMVAHAGILQAVLIIAFSTAITFITALSMSALSTNGEMKGGGVYHMISRSFGPAWGGTLGLVFSFANCATAALHTIGFSGTLVPILSSYGLNITGNPNYYNYILSIAIITAMMGVILVGKEFEAKFQVALLISIIIPMISFVAGALRGPIDDMSMAKGFVGIKTEIFLANLWPDYRNSEGLHQNFFTILSVFFQATAGIQAGASVSGDLKDPASAVPKGTILAIIITSLGYTVFAVLTGAGTMREATGDLNQVVNESYFFDNCATTCSWGLYHDYQVSKLMSIYGWLFHAGCWAAALSDILSCLGSGFEMFEALAKDEIIPGTKRLGQGFGKSQEPYYTYILGYITAILFVFIGGYTSVAPLVSDMYGLTFAYLNFAVFYADIVKPVGWRPTFKYHNRWISLVGAVMCIQMLFFMDYITGIISLICITILHQLVACRNLNHNWGDFTQARTHSAALSGIRSVSASGKNPKRYRPQLLVLSGHAQSRPELVAFGHLLTRQISFMILANVEKSDISHNSRQQWISKGNEWLRKRNISAYCAVIDSSSLNTGVKHLLQASGIGKLTPNLVLIGYKSDWQICGKEPLQNYYQTIVESVRNNAAVAILRIKHGFDQSNFVDYTVSSQKREHESEFRSYHNLVTLDEKDPGCSSVLNKLSSLFHMECVVDDSLFLRNQHEGTVDVWCCSDDDDELKFLVSQIISTKSNWKMCKFRILVIVDSSSNPENERRRKSNLLRQLGVTFSELIFVRDTFETWGLTSTILFSNDNAPVTPKSEADCAKRRPAGDFNHTIFEDHWLRVFHTRSLTLANERISGFRIAAHKASHPMERQEGKDICPNINLTPQTQEVLPKLDHYRYRSSIRAVQRPSLVHLVQNTEHVFRDGSQNGGFEKGESSRVKKEPTLGWIEGVLIRSILNIWGIPLFLRMSWIAAHAGILQAMIIIGISTFITIITTLSMSALSTNGEVKGGGMYYMLSRSLGPAWGGSLGAVFSFANSATAALHTVGFSETLISILEQYGLTITGDPINDNRIISLVVITAMQGVILVGKEFEAKCQLGLFVIILVTIGDFIVGCIMGPQDDLSKARGFVGISSKVFLANLGPGYRKSEGVDQNFFTILSIFFQAAAGIQAGASSSGDLKDPGAAIPKGTLIAIVFTSLSYALFAVVPAAGTLREATGNINDVVNGSYILTNCTVPCKCGLYNDYQVAKLMSAVSWLMYAGCFAAALSDSLSCLISGIEMFSALGKDEIYPYTKKLGKGFGKQLEPYYSYLVGYLIAASFVLIAGFMLPLLWQTFTRFGDYNTIAPIISNMFMVTYAYLNFAVFFAGIVKPVGWRPSFKYYNRWLSLLGCVLCVGMIFLINWKAGVISVVCVLALYAIAKYKKNPGLSWGDLMEARTYSNALSAIQKASSLPEHPKNYRPQLLVLVGDPSVRRDLVRFGQLLTNKLSLMILANIQKSSLQGHSRSLILEQGRNWISTNDVDGYYQLIDECSLDKGAKYLLQSAGLGTLCPNILLMGYKNDWKFISSTGLLEYFGVIRETFDNNCAIAILRVRSGLYTSQSCPGPSQNGQKYTKGLHVSYINPISPDPTDPEVGAQEAVVRDMKNDFREIPVLDHQVSLFSGSKQKTIDVWWIYDDGGLTLLLPYLISTHKCWESCNLRIFATVDGQSHHDEEKLRISTLLKKFRIKHSEVITIDDLCKKPGNDSIAFFDTIVTPFKESADGTYPSSFQITNTDLVTLHEQTNKQLRLRELLLEHSMKADLIVMTLPIPHKNVPPSIYLTWLETLTCDLPSFLLVRGNQTSVLTLYS